MFVIDKSKYICDNILYNYCRKEDLSFTYIFTTSAREIEMEVIYEKKIIYFPNFRTSLFTILYNFRTKVNCPVSMRPKMVICSFYNPKTEMRR